MVISNSLCQVTLPSCTQTSTSSVHCEIVEKRGQNEQFAARMLYSVAAIHDHATEPQIHFFAHCLQVQEAIGKRALEPSSRPARSVANNDVSYIVESL